MTPTQAHMEDCDGDLAEIEQIVESRANAAAAEVGEPSDSKVATVAKAIKEAHECYGNEYTTMACAAIEAGAAEVGGCHPAACRDEQLWRDAIAATIERCAQVVRERAAQYDHQNNNQENALWGECMEIIDVIEALKEKP